MHMAYVALIGVLAVGGLIAVATQNIQMESQINDAVVETLKKETDRQEESLRGYIDADGNILIKNRGFNTATIMMYGINSTAGHSNVMFVPKINSTDVLTTLSHDTLMLPLHSAPTVKPGEEITITPPDTLDTNGNSVGFIVSDLARKYPLENLSLLAGSGIGTVPRNGTSGDTDLNIRDKKTVGRAMIDGMGIQSRIIQKEHKGRITHGSGVHGFDDSLKPYLQVSQNTDFAATVLKENIEDVLDISDFYQAYNYVGNNEIIKSFGNKCNTDTVSVQQISSGDGYIEMRIQETNKNRWFGLDSENTGNTQHDIDYAIHVNLKSRLVVTEGSPSLKYFGKPDGVSSGDIVKISIEGNQVKYYQNDVLFYTSAKLVDADESSSSSYPFHADAVLCAPGATIKDAKIFSSGKDGKGVQNIIWDQTVTESNILLSRLTKNTNSEGTNILGYADHDGATRTGITSTQGSDGIRVSGDGVRIFKINPMQDENLIFRAAVPDGASVKLVQSKNDLTQIPYDGTTFTFYSGTHSGTLLGDKGLYYIGSYCRTQGALISDTWPNPLLNFKRYGCGYTAYGYTYNAGPATKTFADIYLKDPDAAINCSLSSSVRYGVYTGSFGYGHASVAVSGDVRVASPDVGDGYHRLDSISKPPVTVRPPGVTGTINAPVSATCVIREAQPYDTLVDATKDIAVQIDMPSNDVYLIVKPNGGTVDIMGESSADLDFIDIDGLPPNIPYQITQDRHAILTGMTSESGDLTINTIANPPATPGGKLRLFPDALAYRGPFSTIVFDNIHNEIIRMPATADTVYVVHAYAQIPVTGTITVSELNLDKTLQLPYLNGDYTTGDVIHVPILPNHKTINLRINDIPASLRYADILGGTGIKIADPTAATITRRDLDDSIRDISATAGTATYAVATSDGTINAVISITFSGSASIANKYTLQEPPPPPPPPRPADPLKAYVEIYKNGERYGDDRITLGINPHPVSSPSAGLSGNIATQSITYRYPDHTLTGTATVNVNAGDFVEFYIYGNIYGVIGAYIPPAGWAVTAKEGVASAVVDIRNAHITTSSN